MRILIPMCLLAAVLLWSGAMCMTFADTFAGLVMALIGLGILCLAGKMSNAHLV